MSPKRINEHELELDEDQALHQGIPFTGVSFLEYPNGQLREESNYVNGFEEGLCREWYDNGNRKREWFAVHGQVQGKMCLWHKNGTMKSVGDYQFGVEMSFDEWNDQGELLVSRRIDPTSKVFRYVELMRAKITPPRPPESES